MESFLNRFRNITVLLLVVFAQLILLAVQVKNNNDVRIIRLWTVTAVTPVARLLEGVRGGTTGLVRNYILIHQADDDNRRLQTEVGRLKLENIFLKNELNTADRVKALQVFQDRTPSKSVAANIIGTGAGSLSKVVFVDRGSAAGVQRGMAVVTPEGIVGKVIESYPTASEVLLVTDVDFAAGVTSQKNQVRGTLKGQGTPLCKVDYVAGDDKVEPGELFYTSGDDRVFPRGFPVGVVKSVHEAQPFKEIYLEPSGLQHGLEDVLILIDAVHQAIPDAPPANQQVYLAPPLPDAGGTAAVVSAGSPGPASGAGTDADKLRSQYKAIGDAQGHKFGEGLPGSKAPDFNLKPSPPGAVATPASAPSPQPGPANPQGTAGRGAGGAPAGSRPANPQGPAGRGASEAPSAPPAQPGMGRLTPAMPPPAAQGVQRPPQPGR
jgi:rod shape-determining protein MreC